MPLTPTLSPQEREEGAATWEVRRPPTVKIRTTNGEENGEESNRIPQIAGACWRREPVAADRAGARSARPQHHGVLQSVQCADPEDGEGDPDPRHYHHVSGPLLHLRAEDAPGLVFPQEG